MVTNTPDHIRPVSGVMLTFVNAAIPDDQFDAWYDQVHVPEVLAAVPSITSVSRYRLSPAQRTELPQDTRRYVTIYAFETESTAVLLHEFGQLQEIRNKKAADGETDVGAVDLRLPPLSVIYERIV